jgi:1-acyl-sn-glycerol-3-phosphate acyltransferase
VAEVVDYRTIVAASQSVAWAVGQALKLRFAIEVHRPPGLFEHGSEQCLILAPTHQSSLDPWLIMSALRYRQWRALTPVRTLTSQSYGPPLSWFTPLVRALYRLEGAVELPPKEEGGTLPEKVQGLLDALKQGDIVAIFPEGRVRNRKKRHPPVGEFAPGVVYLQRRSGADIVPMAVWMSAWWWPRRRYVIEIGRPVRIPESLDLEAGAAWLRERTLELYERARQGAKKR